MRFQPPSEGTWYFNTLSNAQELAGKHGSFTAVPPVEGEHGPVRAEGRHFVHADGAAAIQSAAEKPLLQRSLCSLGAPSGRLAPVRLSVAAARPLQLRDLLRALRTGTEHFSVGTTAYAWVHQPEKLRKATLETLRTKARFNKARALRDA